MPPSTIVPATRPEPTALTGASWLPSPGGIQGATGATGPTVSATDSPWCRTTQIMNVNYIRVPYITYPQWSPMQQGLTQFSAIDNVNGTRVQVVATITTKRQKVYLPVGTSAFTQLQKFELAGQTTDQYGQSYGVVSGFIMGPGGSINTIQPYIKSELWKTGLHEEYHITQIGTNFQKFDTSTLMFSDSTNFTDPAGWYLQDHQMWRAPRHSGPTSWPWKSLCTYENLHYMPGGYNTSAEAAWNNLVAGRKFLIQVIEKIADQFCGTTTNYRMAVPFPQYSDGKGYLVDADRVDRNLYYDTDFHDYT